MNTVERSPSPLMFTKQHSDSEPSPSSSLAVPSVTMSLPTSSPQVKRKFTDGVRRIKKLAKRSSTAENDYQDSGSESQFRDKFSKVMNQLVSSSKQPKNRSVPQRRYSTNEDGYSSDPGITHDVSEDEVDSAPDPDIERQITNTEKKLQKARENLQQEEELMSRECQGGDSSQENETGGGETRRSKPKIPFRLKASGKNYEQLKKKIEKYEHQLELLRNGVIPEGTHGNHKFWIARQVEDRIRSVGTTMSSGVKNRLMGGMYLLKIKKRPDGEEFEEDEILNGSPSDSQIIANGEESITLEAASDAISDVAFIDRENIEKVVQEKIQAAIHDSDERLIQQFRNQAELIENQRMTIERLDNQMTELIDLQQREVSELQQQLSQIQTHTMEKLQDFDDTIEEYQSKLKQLEVNMHLQGPFNPQLQVVSSRMLSSTLVTKLLSILLVITSFCLAIKTHLFNGYYLIKNNSSDPIRKYILLLTVAILIIAIVYSLLY